jgi:hypothetical protein
VEEKSNRDLETALDHNDYDPSQLISVKIPISYLPYYNNSSSFERIDGQIEIEGTEYKYVKRRIFNDSLELLCIPNHTTMKLKKVNNEFFQFVNDLQHNGQNRSSNAHHNLFKSFSGDYYPMNHRFSLTGIASAISLHLFQYASSLASRDPLILEQPPEFI